MAASIGFKGFDLVGRSDGALNVFTGILRLECQLKNSLIENIETLFVLLVRKKSLESLLEMFMIAQKGSEES